MTGWELLLILVTAPIWLSLIVAVVAALVSGIAVWAMFMYLCAREIKRGYE